MNKREYFYKDKDGKMQKYVYCNMCPDGKPFTADQEYDHRTKQGLFITSGTHIVLCLSCAKNLGVFKSEEAEEPMRLSYVGPRKHRKAKIIKKDMSNVGSAQ